jgi:hypothetical protein
MRYAATTMSAAILGAMLASTASLSAAPAPGACSLLRKDEMKKFSSNQFFDQFPPEEEKAGNGSGCNYAGVYIQIDPFPFSTIDTMRRQPGRTFEAAPGIGDAAFASNNKGEYAELFAKIGQRVFTIQMDVGPNETYASVKPRLLALAAVMAARLK